jgi:hypothetical protein
MWWPYLVAGSLRMRDALLVDRAKDRVRPATPPRGGGVDLPAPRPPAVDEAWMAAPPATARAPRVVVSPWQRGR